MTELITRRSEFEHENKLHELFVVSNDLSIIESNRIDSISWFMAFGRYLKTIRQKSDSIQTDEQLYKYIENILNKKYATLNRGLLLILKQCVYLYPTKLIHLSFQHYLSINIIVDQYLKYKYVRLLRLILDEIDEQSINEIFPSSNDLITNITRFDQSIIIFLEKFVYLKSDNNLQLLINQIYDKTLNEYLKDNDFDDDEIIDLCSILFQINQLKTIDCKYKIVNIFHDLFLYINYEIETMINWLLTPETGEKFLIFILRLIKYFSSNQIDFQNQLNKYSYEKLLNTLKLFYEHLKNAYEKSLFPYNIKPLLNAFQCF